MTDLIGQTIGQYRIVEKIGKGGMADVYKAYQPSLDRYVAIKILPEYFLRDETFLARFQREAQAIARLSHSNILPVYDFGQQDNLTYIVMQYVEAGTLKDTLGQTLDLRLAAEIIGQVADALDYAHEQGIIHRDVKPGNVLMDRGRRALLSDFGLAKMTEASIQLTGSGVGVGTPAYMSPEQGQGKVVDARSDVYSLGVVLYEMATGQVPYTAETPMAIVIKHITEALPLPRTVNPALPEAVERVILKTLAKTPTDRFASAGAMARALRDAVAGLPAAAEPAPTAAEITITPPRRPEPVDAPTPPPGAPLPPARESVSSATLERKIELPLAGILVGGAGLGIVAILLLVAVVAGIILLGGRGAGTPSPTAGAAAEARPTKTPEGEAAAEATPATPAPATPSDTPEPTPTDTPLPPTATHTPKPTPLPPTPTYTPQAPTPTNTPLPPTPTDTPPPPPPAAASGLPVLPDGWAYASNLSGNWEIYLMQDGQPRQLTDHPAHDCCPTWSPDGSKIAFYRKERDTDGNGLITVDDNEELWVMNADGSNPVQVSADGGDKTGRWWSPDSRKLAFETRIQDRDGDGDVDYYDQEVYIVGADGSGLVAVPGPESVYNDFLGWTPEGQRLLIRSQLDTNGDGQLDYDDDAGIYSIDSSGGGLAMLSESGGDVWSSSSYVSPDGTRLAFYAWHYRDSNADGQIDYNDENEIYVMNLDGSGLAALTQDNLNDSPSQWSPDGGKILFRKEIDGELKYVYDLYTVSADGSGTVRLTDDPSYKISARWSPDGSQVVFIARPEDTDDDGRLSYGDKEAIWLVGAGGGPIVKLSDLHADAYYYWSPDSQRLAIRTRDRDSNGDGEIDSGDVEQLLIVSADGGQRVGPLLSEGDFSHRWTEDGSALYVIYRSQDSNGDGLMGVDDDGEIYVASPDGSKLTPLSAQKAGYWGFYLRP